MSPRVNFCTVKAKNDGKDGVLSFVENWWRGGVGIKIGREDANQLHIPGVDRPDPEEIP
jgi:hypothetical protein